MSQCKTATDQVHSWCDMFYFYTWVSALCKRAHHLGGVGGHIDLHNALPVVGDVKMHVGE